MTDDNLKPIEVMWSAAKVASYIGVNTLTIYRWIKEGQIHDFRKMGRTIRIPQSEVQRLMNAQKAKIINRASDNLK